MSPFTDSDIHCARMVRGATLLLSAFSDALESSDNLDLNRLSRAQADESIEKASDTEKEAFKIFVSSFSKSNKQLEIVISLLEQAEFKGHSCPKFLEALNNLSLTLTSAGQVRHLKDLIELRRTVKEDLLRIRQLANKVLEACGPSGISGEVTFRILLITDLHWRIGTSEDRWRDVEKPFFDSLSEVIQAGNDMDLVLFAGDLVFSGDSTQFDGLNNFFTRLWPVLLNDQNKAHRGPPLFAIPGNHDLRRPSESDQEHALNILNAFFENTGVRASVLNVQNSEAFRLINRAFSAYSLWQENNISYQIGEGKIDGTQYKKGKLPGDFSYRFSKDGKTLGIVGLNTSFLQLTAADFERRLALDSSQFHACCAPNGRSWLSSNDANILFTHHPPEWLHETSEKDFLCDICVPEFDAYFCGHLHFPAAKPIGDLSRMVKKFQGISLFGESHYYDRKRDAKVKRAHGYFVLELKVTPRINTVRLYPVEFTDDKRPVTPHEIEVEKDHWTRHFYRLKRKP